MTEINPPTPTYFNRAHQLAIDAGYITTIEGLQRLGVIEVSNLPAIEEAIIGHIAYLLYLGCGDQAAIERCVYAFPFLFS